jgi:hypothetical protein
LSVVQHGDARPGLARVSVVPVPTRVGVLSGRSSEHLTLVAWSLAAWVALVLFAVVTLLLS